MESEKVELIDSGSRMVLIVVEGKKGELERF